MTYFIIRRLFQSFLLLIAVTAVCFAIQQSAPGGPELLASDPRLPPDYAEQQRKNLGLDRPLYQQYGTWVWNLAHLDFGVSFADRRPVIDKIKERAPNTLLLSGTGLLIGLLGIPMGVLAALRRGGLYDQFLRIFTVLGNAVPHWWLGLVILIISVKTVNWFPLGGLYSPNTGGDLLDRLHHLLLPATLTGLTGWLLYSRFMRSEFLEVMTQDYVRTAHAKGLARRVVLFRHAFRNALIVVLTILGAQIGVLLSGAVLFENIFSWPGMGRLFIESAFQRDYPVLMGLVVVNAVMVILGNLLADIAYGFVDPRIKYS